MLVRSVVTLAALLFGLTYSAPNSAQINYEPMEKGASNNLVKLAKETEELFVRRGVLFKDAELQEIVDRVGESIFPRLLDDFIGYRIYLIRDPSPLMFSLADGQIYVHTGLLARLDNEAQLAAALAHEAHHVAAHHHIQANSSRRTKAQFAGGIAAVMNKRESGTLFPDEFFSEGTTYSSNIGHITRSEFSDNMEFDADAASIGLIGRAGHPPMAALQTLARIRKDPELSTPSPLASFTNIDSLTERQGRLQELVDGLPVQSANAVAGTEIRPLILRRVIEMTIDDYIRLDRPGTAVALIDSMIAVQPDAFLYAAKGDSHMALGPRPTYKEFLTTNWGMLAKLTRAEADAYYLETEQGRARFVHNTESAIQAYNMSIELDENNARAYRGLGNLYFDQENYRQSGRNYVKYLKLSPAALDRPLVLQNLQHIRAELSKQQETEK